MSFLKSKGFRHRCRSLETHAVEPSSGEPRDPEFRPSAERAPRGT